MFWERKATMDLNELDEKITRAKAASDNGNSAELEAVGEELRDYTAEAYKTGNALDKNDAYKQLTAMAMAIVASAMMDAGEYENFGLLMKNSDFFMAAMRTSLAMGIGVAIMENMVQSGDEEHDNEPPMGESSVSHPER